MNKSFTIIFFVLLAGSLLFSRQAIAQAPDKMSYQAVIRNSSGELVTDQEVGLRVSILQNSIDGTTVYQEIYNPHPRTNSNGLLILEIGTGVPLAGTFSEIDWSDGPYFIMTETDPFGGTTYTITGTSQLLSVPYALHAKTVEETNFVTYEIGDFAHGGVVFYVEPCGTKGLVCARDDQSGIKGIRWYAGTSGYTRAKGDGPYAGKANTSIIIAAHVAIGDDGNNYAARLCNELQVTEGGKTYGDWYLPSSEELILMAENKAAIDATATANDGSALSDGWYWSSTETDNIQQAWILDLYSISHSAGDKNHTHRVRAIRAF